MVCWLRGVVATRADVDRLASLNRSVSNLIIRDLAAFWSTLDLNKPETARDRLLEFVPVLVRQYGDIAATVSADWYTQIRASSSAPGTFRPVLGSPAPTEAVTGTIRRVAGDLFTDHPIATLDALNGPIAKYAIEAGRNTILRSSRRDPWKPRVARVPSGATTCAFCLMLASRGPVYWSEETAGRFDKFHPDDDCQITVIGKGDALPGGYDPDALYAQYQEARQTALAEHTSPLDELRRSDAANVADSVHTHAH